MSAATGSINFTTIDLMGVIESLVVPQQALLENFFPASFVSDTAEVALDIEVWARRMAPFVNPIMEGKVQEQLKYQTDKYTPPYVKPKRIPDLFKPVLRMPGEKIGGSKTAQERAMQNLAKEMADMINTIKRREEWMAASALQNGTVTVSGEGFPTAVIDFGRAATHSLTLASGAKWTSANIGSEASPGSVSPVGDVQTWQTLILKDSGAVARDLIFTSISAFNAFMLDWRLKGAIYYPQLGVGNAINPGAQVDTGMVYKGRWGDIDLWLYNDWYLDDSGTQYPMLTAGGVILVSRTGLAGKRGYGAIMDPEIGYIPMAYAPKTWTSQDPPARFIMVQSSPLVIPGRPNASLAATVL